MERCYYPWSSRRVMLQTTGAVTSELVIGLSSTILGANPHSRRKWPSSMDHFGPCTVSLSRDTSHSTDPDWVITSTNNLVTGILLLPLLAHVIRPVPKYRRLIAIPLNYTSATFHESYLPVCHVPS